MVLNADTIKRTGNKGEGKNYYRHSLYPGGFVTTRADKLRGRHPARIVRAAVWGMLPKGRLGRKMIKKLKIYSGSEHQHAAQKPQPLAL